MNPKTKKKLKQYEDFAALLKEVTQESSEVSHASSVTSLPVPQEAPSSCRPVA